MLATPRLPAVMATRACGIDPTLQRRQLGADTVGQILERDRWHFVSAIFALADMHRRKHEAAFGAEVRRAEDRHAPIVAWARATPASISGSKAE